MGRDEVGERCFFSNQKQPGGFVREHRKVPEIWDLGLRRHLHRSSAMHRGLGLLVFDGG